METPTPCMVHGAVVGPHQHAVKQHAPMSMFAPLLQLHVFFRPALIQSVVCS